MNHSLSQTQMGIYVTCMNSQEEGNYNIDMLFSLDNEVDTDRLAKAIDAVVEAHPYIKSRLTTDDAGEVVLEDHSADEYHCSVVEVDSIDDVRSHLGEDYDLMHDQLFRLEIYRTKNGNYLYADFHHIIFDGMSFVNFTGELDRAYSGQTPVGEDVDGFEVAEREAEVRESDACQDARKWYAGEYAEASEVESMPIPDKAPVQEEHFADTCIPLDIDKDMVDAMCSKNGCKESMLFTSAFALTLAKYTYDDKAFFNTIYHGRTDKRTRNSFCMMVQTLPVFIDFNKYTTVAEVVGKASEQISSARKNAGYSYGDACTDLGIASGICFAYQGTLNSFELTLDGRKQQSEYLYKHHPGLQLSIRLVAAEGKYAAKVDYPVSKYSDQMIRGMMKAFSQIVAEMCIKENLAEIECCNADTKAELDSFNEKFRNADYTFTEETVIDAFCKAAKQYPDHVAAVFKDKKYTYRQLDELTDSIGALIASKIENSGKAEPVVSILIPRNEYMFILPLAAMKAGCAYQPLDPSYPQERLNFMVKDADAALLIADPELKDIINEYEGEVVLTSELQPSSLLPTPSSLLPTLSSLLPTPSSLMILLYTSGSTGVPKGVMLEHRNVMAYVRWYQQNYGMTADSIAAAYASFGFDADMMDLYPPLTLGATICIIPEETRLDLIALRNFMNDNKVTHAFMTTQVAQQFALNVDGCKTLKHLSMGGEKMMAMNPHPEFKLHNIYGPTECSVAVTHFQLDEYEANIPIGSPTYTSTLKIVDKNFHRVPVGAAGELWINGPQVGRGYLNRPEKTAEAFVEHEGKRWYRTGDIVRYRQDGCIEFVGRKDGQVKIRGFRIELKEVEAVIRDFPGIKDVTVQAFDDPNGGKFIAAYVVSSDGPLDIDALNAFILDQKPPYMVPAVTMQIDKIPLNVNQKVDKKALPKPELQSHAKGDAPAAPLNALETELKAIIASVVNTEDFTITDVLGYVGLTSISSIRLATLLYKKFGVQVDSKSLAKTATLQSIENDILAKWMQGESVDNTSKPSTLIPQPSSNSPLTYPQIGVYLDCLKNPGTTMYNVPSKLTFPLSVKADELAAAVKATIENHQSFRLTFANIEGETKHILNAEMEVFVPVSKVSEDDVKAFENEYVRPFNLAQGPLFRCEIVETSEHLYLFIDMHHLITDGGSVDIIIKEIIDRLEGKAVESEDYSYLQFADEQKADEANDGFAASKAFYDDRLQSCEGASEITADKPKDESAVHTLGVCRHPVEMNAVEKLAKQLGVTPMSIFLAASYYAVSRFVNNKQVYLGTISNGRSNLRTYNTTGMFVNTLALSSEIKEQTVNEFIKETAQNFSDTLDHEQYPFSQIAADYGFQPEIVFEYQVGVMSEYQARGSKVDMQILHLDLAKFKMKISVYDAADGGHDIVIGYDEALYTQELAQRLAESLCTVVENFTLEPASQVKRISIMSEAQRSQVEAFHTTAKADIPFKRFYEPIEYWAEKTPDNLAVYACDRQLTFKEFNAECNRVAHALMARGLKRGDRVVLLLPRTSQVLCCIFGVSKTGAAYIPCDPAYPAERINLITEDSEATYVITTREHMAEHENNAILVDDLFCYNEGGESDFENPCVDVKPEDLAYLIYTSGSTGRPKGVMLRHIGICSYLFDHPANIHIHGLKTEGVKAFLCITTLSFDMSLKEFAGALHNGITAVLANEDEVNNPILLAELFRKTGAEAINGTPSRILNCMESDDFCEALSHCKVIWSGGEKYSDKLLQRLHEMNLRIFNTYGPTEITVSSNIGELTHQKNITVGRPLLNYTEFVVDCDGNELPAGVVGELYIGGPGVALGYNNLQEQTAERFIKLKIENGKLRIAADDEPDAFRVYKSGDYARWLPDGQVDILGRLDNQVKLNGLRIELGEVESAISNVQGVKQTVVMIRNISGRDHLSAYYVADRVIDIEDMKQQIGQTLTHYMVPTAYLQMEKFPLTPNGKTDLKHLPEPQLAQLGGDYVAPKNKVEEDFCHAFEHILDLEKVSAADSFFDLGGTSLTATRVIIEAKNYGYDIAYSDVFSHPTAQSLSQLVGGTDDDNIDHEVADYDYTRINELLSKNNLDSFRNGERMELADVILTGANGYLGIHILYNLLENHLRQHPEYKVYCLVRHGRNGVSSEARLRNLLFYYFAKNYKALFGKQIIVVDGDVTSSAAFDEIEKAFNLNPSSLNHTPPTLINCAAIVKHFSNGTEIEDINIGGLQKCVEFCLKTGTRLIQTSTNSTGGQSVNGYPDPHTNYSEQVHYFGQSLTSKYTRSKFLAERIVLENIIDNGLVAKVIRLGNLAPRAVDGEFQINFRSNSSMGRLHIYQMLGAYSYGTAVSKMEFSPIDEVAEAVLKLASTPKACCIFHAFNNHMELMGDIIREMGKTLDMNIEEVEEDVFQARLNEAAQDPEKAKILQSMLAYKAGGKDKVSYFAKYNPYTIQVLARLGFHWNVTSWDYVQQFISTIAAMDFFEDKR